MDLISQISDTSHQVNDQKISSVTREEEVIFCVELWGISKAQMRREDRKSQPWHPEAQRAQLWHRHTAKKRTKHLAEMLCQAESMIKTTGLTYTISRHRTLRFE